MKQKILWCVDISTVKTDRIVYRGWQLELFLYSMIEKGGIAQEDICVTCYMKDLENGLLPQYYNEIFSLFPKVKISFDVDLGYNPLYNTMDRGLVDYCAINKAGTLISVHRNGYNVGYDVIALLDLDAYMFGKANFDAYPTVTTLTNYPPMDPENCCRVTTGLQGQKPWAEANYFADLWGNPWTGIDLTKIMEAIKVPEANLEMIKAGSYNVFIAQEDFTEELVYGFQYFTIAIKALCAAAGHPHIWQAEMGSYPLALASYGIDFELGTGVEINDCAWNWDVPEGSLCTYAFDGFSIHNGSAFRKGKYMDRTPFSDERLIEQGLEKSNCPAELAFYEYCREIKINHLITREA